MSLPDTVVKPSTTMSYQPLVNSDEIRLLYLQPRHGTATIECSLKHVNLSGNPAYEALSYMWGEKIMKTIHLDGTGYEVRENLWHALDHLRLDDAVRILWIDAICINQADIDERGHQVKLMGKVYTQASGVVAWIGQSDDSSSITIGLIEELNENKQALKSSIFLSKIVRGCRIGYNQPEKSYAHRFCHRAYWSRLLIIQEILLASNVMVQCGAQSLSLHYLEYFFLWIERILWGELGNSLLADDTLGTYRTPLYRLSMSACAKRVLARQQIRQDFYSPAHFTRQPLLFLVSRHNDARCSVEQDRVLGLCGMSTECCLSGMSLSYDATFDELCDKILTHHLHIHCPKSQVNVNEYVWLTATRFYGSMLQRLSMRDRIITRHDLVVNDIGSDTLQIQANIRGRIAYLTPTLDMNTFATGNLPTMSLGLKHYLKQLESHFADMKARALRRNFSQVNDGRGCFVSGWNEVVPINDSRFHKISIRGAYLSPIRDSLSKCSTWAAKTRMLLAKFMVAAYESVPVECRSRIRLAFDGECFFYVPQTTQLGDMVCHVALHGPSIVCRQSQQDLNNCRIVGLAAGLYERDAGWHPTDLSNSDVGTVQDVLNLLHTPVFDYSTTHTVNLGLSCRLLSRLVPQLAPSKPRIPIFKYPPNPLIDPCVEYVHLCDEKYGQCRCAIVKEFVPGLRHVNRSFGDDLGSAVKLAEQELRGLRRSLNSYMESDMAADDSTDSEDLGKV
ncbi:hypothetical protein VTL71DRAFT_8612 [Oculimacula yallundae]|uniref:Heterokaryon incompatibility domain-containing protein n=1 Tax=Oculimacula yallundae TaxID=86028 RepID=A0ABR4CYC3_9HELO